MGCVCVRVWTSFWSGVCQEKLENCSLKPSLSANNFHLSSSLASFHNSLRSAFDHSYFIRQTLLNDHSDLIKDIPRALLEQVFVDAIFFVLYGYPDLYFYD